MAGIAHLSFGFAGKWLSDKVPLFVLLIFSELIEILWFIFWLTGVEGAAGAPWSHGLLMSVIWSLAAALVMIPVFKDVKAGLAIGIVTFGHWILDFITHPMGAIMKGEPAAPDLFLAFYNSPRVGLGLYNYSLIVAIIFELAFLGIGILSYLIYTKRKKSRI